MKKTMKFCYQNNFIVNTNCYYDLFARYRLEVGYILYIFKESIYLEVINMLMQLCPHIVLVIQKNASDATFSSVRRYFRR